MSTKKLYLTKNRKKALDVALSMDDVLYRKYEVMREDLDKYARYLNRTYKNVIQVKERKDNADYLKQIIDVQKVEGEGLIIVIR